VTSVEKRGELRIRVFLSLAIILYPLHPAFTVAQAAQKTTQHTAGWLASTPSSQPRPNPQFSPLSVSKTSSGNPLLGGQISYEITVVNPSANPKLYNLTITDTLPNGLQFVSSSIPPTTNTYNAETGETDLRWVNIADLAPGESYSLSFIAQVKTSYADGSPVKPSDTLTNTSSANVNSDPFGTGTVIAGNLATEVVRVTAISMSKGANQSTAVHQATGTGRLDRYHPIGRSLSRERIARADEDA
jgi:uncharacterized repeat protein (TIGR01451 family)